MEKENKDYGSSRGEESEEKVCQILEELKAEGMIKDFGRSLKFYQEDRSGRDVLITTNNDKAIWLQVKSSFNPVDKEKYLKRGILYIAIGEKSLPEIKKEILWILNKARNRKRRPKRETKVEVSI